ncbi:MAG: DUF2779 domain-containing protein [Alcanivoracaceae bacterium]
MRTISKSRFMSGRQCPKRLWQEIHHPERADGLAAGTEFTFYQGHEVGALAREWRGDGVLIELDRSNIGKALAETRQAMAAGARRIYEATFEYQGFLALADVIEKKRDGSWRLIEVKATTRAKDVHVPDLAFQAWLMTRNGLAVSETAVVHLHSQAVWPEDELLTLTGNTREVLSSVPEVAAEARKMAKLIASTTEPDIAPGAHCSHPYPCTFQRYCWRDVPGDHLGVIPRLSAQKLAQLQARGWARVAEIADVSLLSVAQRRWVSAMQSGQPYVDEAAIRNWLDALEYPLYSLDFETVAYAVPRWKGVSPYQQIPFQFSCHRLGPRGALSHRDYLHSGQDDPRAALADALIESVGDSGSILAWNASFEKRVIGELAACFPRKRAALMRIAERLVDLMDVFRSWYLHPECMGSSSIKVVGKAVLGEQADYASLAIGSGDQAYVAWHERVFADGGPELVQALREYCKQDTLLPLQLLGFLRDRFL